MYKETKRNSYAANLYDPFS